MMTLSPISACMIEAFGPIAQSRPICTSGPITALAPITVPEPMPARGPITAPGSMMTPSSISADRMHRRARRHAGHVEQRRRPKRVREADAAPPRRSRAYGSFDHAARSRRPARRLRTARQQAGASARRRQRIDELGAVEERQIGGPRPIERGDVGHDAVERRAARGSAPVIATTRRSSCRAAA